MVQAGGDPAGAGHPIGVGAQSTEFVASRLFPVIVIRPQLRTLPQLAQQRFIKPPESSTLCRTTPACPPAVRSGWGGWR